MAKSADNITKLRLEAGATVLSDNAVTNADDSTLYPTGTSSVYVQSQGFPSTDDGVLVTNKVGPNYMQQQFTSINEDKLYVRRWDMSSPSVNPLEQFNTGLLNTAKWYTTVNGNIPPTFGADYIAQGGDYVHSHWKISHLLDWVIEFDIKRTNNTAGNAPEFQIANTDGYTGGIATSFFRFTLRGDRIVCYYPGSSVDEFPANYTQPSQGTLRLECSVGTGIINSYWYEAFGGDGGVGNKTLVRTSNTAFGTNDYLITMMTAGNYVEQLKIYEVRVISGSVINLPTVAAWSAWQGYLPV